MNDSITIMLSETITKVYGHTRNERGHEINLKRTTKQYIADTGKTYTQNQLTMMRKRGYIINRNDLHA